MRFSSGPALPQRLDFIEELDAAGAGGAGSIRDDPSRTPRDVGSQREADSETGITARPVEALEAIRADFGETPAPVRGPTGPLRVGLTEEPAGSVADRRAPYGGSTDAGDEAGTATPSIFSGPV